MTETEINVVPGDIVLIVDNSAPRNSWIVERILKNMPDATGITCLYSDRNLSVGKTNNKTLLIARSRRRVTVYMKTVNIQWVWKVFRPAYIFHSLLYCSHLLK